MLKLNLGCGGTKLPGWINVDANPELGDEHWNLLEYPWPYETGSVDAIILIHVIEHIQKFQHPGLIGEMHRVLKFGGELTIAYPEFETCALNYINNYKGQRDFWEATIFGRQHDLLDTHVALMDSNGFRLLLMEIGFDIDNIRPEPGSEYNTIVKAIRGEQPITYPDHIGKVVFGDNFRRNSNATEGLHLSTGIDPGASL